MPLTLDSTAALRGEKPKRRWTLVMMGHGRWEYLTQALQWLESCTRQGDLLDRFGRIVVSLDGVGTNGTVIGGGFRPDWEYLSTGDERQGLTANLAQAWGALTVEDDWVFFVEEDFLIGDAPLDAMADVLEANPDVAQMALVRQPWSLEEHQAGGLLYGPHLQGDLVDEGGWLRQKRIFTLNPFVAHASLLRSLRPGVETSLTAQCLERGLSFGFWGSMTDPPRVEHIGREGGMGSPLWRP